MTYQRTTGSSRRQAERERTRYLHVSARIVHDAELDENGNPIRDKTHVERGRTYRRAVTSSSPAPVGASDVRSPTQGEP